MRYKQGYLPLLALALLAFSPVPLPPPQPASGPGGYDYPHAAVAAKGPYWPENHFLDANYLYYIYEPTNPTPQAAPVVLFIHGWLAYDPKEYLAWIEHIVRKGYIVVWVQYDAFLKMPWTFADHALETWEHALKRLGTYWWEPHVRPEVDERGEMKTAIMGHSVGGYLSAILAARAPYESHWIPTPYAIVIVEPGGLGIIPAEDFAAIDSATKMVIVVGDEDTAVCKSTALAIWEGTPQIPNENRDFLLVQSDDWGSPAQIANHFFPNTSGFGDTAAVDARDFHVTYKLSVGTLNCALHRTDCIYALGEESNEQIYMGEWSDGRAVRPIRWVKHPQSLETKCQDP